MDLCHRKKMPFRFHPEKPNKHGGVEPERYSFPLQEILKVVKPKKKTVKKDKETKAPDPIPDEATEGEDTPDKSDTPDSGEEPGNTQD